MKKGLQLHLVSRKTIGQGVDVSFLLKMIGNVTRRGIGGTSGVEDSVEQVARGGIIYFARSSNSGHF